LWVGNKLIYFIQINPFELNDEDVKNIRPTSSENLLSEVNKKNGDCIRLVTLSEIYFSGKILLSSALCFYKHFSEQSAIIFPKLDCDKRLVLVKIKFVVVSSTE
jgi:hypothetical protein